MASSTSNGHSALIKTLSLAEMQADRNMNAALLKDKDPVSSKTLTVLYGSEHVFGGLPQKGFKLSVEPDADDC